MESEQILEAQIRECFGRVVYAHKTHEKMADLCATTLRRLKLTQIGISALTSGGALTLVFWDPWGLKLATALFSIATLWITGYMKGFDPGGTAQKHRDAAATLWDIRESYLSLLTNLKSRLVDLPTAALRRDELQSLLAKIYKGVPQTTDKAYQKAQKALKELEDYTFSDSEIDRFLPQALRKQQAA